MICDKTNRETTVIVCHCIQLQPPEAINKFFYCRYWSNQFLISSNLRTLFRGLPSLHKS